MWLLHAHVNVNGQSQFTFPLEQKKSYTLGRRGEKDVQFLSKRVRMDEGRLEVGDWDPSNPKQPPEVIYHVAPKKGKDAIIPRYTIIRPQDQTDKDDLDSYEAVEANEAQVNLAEHAGMGIRFDVGGEVPGWFTLEWHDVCILYDDLKNEPESKSETLYKYCIAYTYTFDPAQLPTITLTSILRPVQSLSYAVCYGLPIAKVLYLDILLDKLDGSWKKAVDSQDSFSLPDYNGLLPDEYDPKMPQYRKNVTSWMADPKRKELFCGWSVLALNPNGKVVAAEKKWMTTMGAEWTDFDLSSVSLDSPSHLVDAALDWIKGVDERHGRGKAIMAHFTSTKSIVETSGVNFTEIVGGAAAELGVRLVNGRVCWQSVSLNSVERCVENLAKSEMNPQAASAPTAPEASTSARRSSSPVKAAPPCRTSPAKPVSNTSEALAIPSTFPDEPTSTTVPVEAEPSAPAPTARRPLKRRAGKAAFDLFAVDDEPLTSADASPQESQEKESGSMSMPPAAQPEDQETMAPTQATQMPTSTNPRTSRLKRRAGATVSAFDLFDSAPPESSAFPGTANGFESIKEESETPAEIRELYEATKRSSKLPPRKTRAASRESAGDVEMDADASTRRSTRAGSARRSEPPEAASAVNGDATDGLASQGTGLEDVMEVDGEDEDFVQRTLRSVAAAKKSSRSQALHATSSQLAMPPPLIPATRRRDASPDDEETEPLESKRARTTGKSKPSASSKVASASSKAAQMDLDGEDEEEEQVEEPNPSNQPTQDTAFLQAISKSRSKKAMDEMDKEFNNLRIPKPATKTAAKGKNSVFGPNATANGQDGRTGVNGDRGKWDGPDYSVLNDFNDEMRGNFIQVVKMDLYRKDGGRKESQEDVSGRPNFKKFKKKQVVRRDPVPLVLVGLHTEEAEMGEPYWPGLTAAPSSRRTQTQTQSRYATQGQALDGGDEDTLPLLPVHRRTQLPKATILEDDEEEDDLGPTPLPATGRRRGVGASQFGFGSAGNSQASTQIPPRGNAFDAGGRRTRGTSVMSEDSNVSGPTRTSRTAATKNTAARANGRNRPQPLLLEDSEEEGVDFTPSAADSSRTKGSTTSRGAAPVNMTRGRRAMPTPTTAGTASTRLFDDDDDLDPPPSAISSMRRPGGRSIATGVPSASMQVSGMGSTAQAQSRIARAKQSTGTGSTGQVRRLVDDDDDDDVIPIAAAKKRRFG